MYAIRSYYDATVLLLGESGTGKELVARAVHNLSSRRELPYLAQFCGSIPDSLLESDRITSYNVCYTKLLRVGLTAALEKGFFRLQDGLCDDRLAADAAGRRELV